MNDKVHKIGLVIVISCFIGLVILIYFSLDSNINDEYDNDSIYNSSERIRLVIPDTYVISGFCAYKINDNGTISISTNNHNGTFISLKECD